jgi:hypothetical protein
MPEDETETHDDLFPRSRHHEKVSQPAKFTGASISLFGMRPSRLRLQRRHDNENTSRHIRSASRHNRYRTWRRTGFGPVVLHL